MRRFLMTLRRQIGFGDVFRRHTEVVVYFCNVATTFIAEWCKHPLQRKSTRNRNVDVKCSNP